MKFEDQRVNWKPKSEGRAVLILRQKYSTQERNGIKSPIFFPGTFQEREQERTRGEEEVRRKEGIC